MANETIDAEKAFLKFSTIAAALPPEEIAPFRLDVDLAIKNVQTAMQVFVAHEADIKTHLPQEDATALADLPALALGLKFAALQVENEPTEMERVEKIKEGWELRGLLMPVAKGLVAAKLIPREDLQPILEGRGARDMAEDCIALSQLFRKYESTIAGKHVVTTAQLDRAAEVGTWLVGHLRVKNAPLGKAEPTSTAVDARNRLATLLLKRYERLQAVAHYFYGYHWEEKAPPLQSRNVKREKQTATPEAPTSPATGTSTP